jgi:hypothetical protein
VIEAQSDGELKAEHTGEEGWVFIKLEHVVREEGWRFDPDRRVTTRMPLVQLRAADIIRRLHAVGAVVPSANPAQQELPLPAPAPEQLAPQKSPPPQSSVAANRAASAAAGTASQGDGTAGTANQGDGIAGSAIAGNAIAGNAGGKGGKGSEVVDFDAK